MSSSANVQAVAAASTPPHAVKKKYVTRACDACKKRKSKCDGRESCGRCVSAQIHCTYKSSYKRVQRQKSVQPGSRVRDRCFQQHGHRSEPSPQSSPFGTVQSAIREESQPVSEALEEDTTDASMHTFLKRVYGHLNSMGQAVPRNLFGSRPAENVLEKEPDVLSFILPNRLTAKEYIDCFFEHSNVTYRYIPRKQVYSLFELFYDENESVPSDSANMAVLLLVMGVGCIWYPSWRNLDLEKYRIKATKIYQVAKSIIEKISRSFPPSITVLQAHVLECQLLLAMNMFNTAWISLGIAVRLGQVIGFQKADTSLTQLEEYSRRGVFWALFMLDRYVSVVLGRPMAINEDDITIPYPEPPGQHLDEDLGPQEGKLTAGVVAHIKLTRITGKIMTKLYPATKTALESRDQIVLSFEKELKHWLDETPSFFHPEQEKSHPDNQSFYDVPWIFKRQQRTVRAAHNFTAMLIYRGYLLDEFLRTNPRTPPANPPIQRIQKCIAAALRIASLASEIGSDQTYNAVYWTTSHFTFCAISILVVYLTLYPDSDDRSKIESILEKAMKGHRKLDQSINYQAQRLLEESRVIAQTVQAGSASEPEPTYPLSHQFPYLNDTSLANCANANTVPVGSNKAPIPQDRSSFQNPAMTFPTAQQTEPESTGYGTIALPEVEHDFFQEMYESGTFGQSDGLDIIMNVGFDSSTFNFLL